jgi:electron transfer flavoprotein alpha subunit
VTTGGSGLLAVLPVRAGVLPTGGLEVVAECGGRAVLVGEGTAAAAVELGSRATEVRAWETPGYRPGGWAGALGPVLATEPVVVLPASADGRDLAPRLAHRLGRPLLAGALAVRSAGAVLSRWGGLAVEEVTADGPFVATLVPGMRGVDPVPAGERPQVDELDLDVDDEVTDAELVEVFPPDVATMDLAESPRILAGGAGLDGPGRFEQLAAVAGALGASVGATRVVTDRRWVGHERQIGTTGVVVDPQLYVAFGISGAVQHTSGLGHPDHIVSVNVDAHCPMMQLADLALVSDANAVLDELATRLGVETPHA